MSRIVQANDFARLKAVTSLELSPREDRIVFSVRRIEEKKRRAYSDLWWASPDGGSRRLTFGDCNDVMPRFTPAGDAIAFLSNRADEKKMRFYLLPVDGGEAEPLGPELRGEVAGFALSPDGRSLFYAFRAADEPVKGPEGKPEQPAVRAIDRLFYRLDGAGWRPRDTFDLYRLDLGKSRPVRLTDDGFENADFHLAADGRTLYYLSCHREDPDRDSSYVDLFCLDLTEPEPRPVKLETPAGPKRLLNGSPDGRSLAWLGHEHPADPAGREPRLFLHDLATATTTNLTGELGFVGGSVIDDFNGICPSGSPRWSPCGRYLHFQLTERGTTGLWRVDLEGGGEPEPMIQGRGALTYFDVGARGVAYAWVEPLNPGEVHWRGSRGRDRRLTSLNTRIVSAWTLNEPEMRLIDNGTEQPIQGWLLKPPNFDPAKRYPAILEVHGGPHVCYGEALIHEFHYLAGRGYVVLYTNPRGGTGYGEAFTRAIVNDWGNHDYHDILAALDHLQALDFVDEKRCGITGGSYGGFMTNWAIGHTDRFAAAVTQRSVSNLIDFFGSSDAGFWFEKEFGHRFPWDDVEHYWSLSPLKSVANVKTPTLVIHSENDLRCPISQGEQVYTALKILGVPTRLIRFPEESHGLSRGGRPDRRVKRLEYIVDWFDKYLA